jgi:hypothetical protein
VRGGAAEDLGVEKAGNGYMSNAGNEGEGEARS